MNRKEFLKMASLSTAAFPFFGDSVVSSGAFLKQSAFHFTPVVEGQQYDVLVVGGSYAGLSAAMSLARCLRKVLVVDAGKPRNETVAQANNIFGNDGVKPPGLKKSVLKQLEKYKAYLTIHTGTVTAISGEDGQFKAETADQQSFVAKKVIFATGAIDTLPGIPGLQEQWGKNVHHCPYCHGFESKEGKVALLSEGLEGLGLAGSLQHWNANLSICTNGFTEINEQVFAFFKSINIPIKTDKIAQLVAQPNGKLKGILFENGQMEAFDHVYVKPSTKYQTGLADALGCKKNKDGKMDTDDSMQCNVKGTYAIGDISSKSMEQIIWSAYSGFMAAVNINNVMIAAKFQKS